MKKLIAIIISLIFIFDGTGYCLRKPMEFWGRRRVVKDFLKEELKRKTPWQVARESGGRLIPIFISDDHSETYWAIKRGIEEGFLAPKNTIVLNFDEHKDTLDDGQDFPFFNTAGSKC